MSHGDALTIYKLQSLIFEPDVVLNIGQRDEVFSRYVSQQFPRVSVVANAQPSTLGQVVARCVWPTHQLALKIDCLGEEDSLFSDPSSVVILRRANFITARLHSPLAVSLLSGIVKGTHRWDSEPPMFYAWRKPDDEQIAGRGDLGMLLTERGLLGNAAEIGVASGCYSREMLQWGMETVLMVDPWEGIWEQDYQEAADNVREFGDRAIIRKTTSVEAAKDVADLSLDFCYIDADHVAGIETDLAAWWPKLRRGGIIAGHDYLNSVYDVNRAVTEFAATHGLHVNLIIEHQDDASFWIEKP